MSWRSIRVLPGPLPGWRYTVGLTEAGRPEILMAGALALEPDAAAQLFAAAVEGATSGPRVHPSWRVRLALACEKRYGGAYEAVQVRPPGDWIDTPDLSTPYDPAAPAWRWVDRDFDVPWFGRRELALVDLDVLRGAPLLEVARLEGAWECWSRTSGVIEPADQRQVPFALLYACDPTLAFAADLVPGEWGTRDDAHAAWELWAG